MMNKKNIIIFIILISISNTILSAQNIFEEKVYKNDNFELELTRNANSDVIVYKLNGGELSKSITGKFNFFYASSGICIPNNSFQIIKKDYSVKIQGIYESNSCIFFSLQGMSGKFHLFYLNYEDGVVYETSGKQSNLFGLSEEQNCIFWGANIVEKGDFYLLDLNALNLSTKEVSTFEEVLYYYANEVNENIINYLGVLKLLSKNN